MKFFQCVAAAVVGASLLLTGAQAYSTEPNPLKYLTIIEDPLIRTPSHRVHAHSSFDLTFKLHGRRLPVKLTLEPNDEILGEGATVHYLNTDGLVRQTEIIERSDHKVYRGQAWVQQFWEESSEWTHVGWARVVVHRDGAHPIFEGAFVVAGDHHHIHPRDTYSSTRNALDPLVEDEREDVMVVWRDSDLVPNKDRGELKRSTGEDSCLSDELTFNVQPKPPVHAGTLKEDDSSWGAFSASSIFGRQLDGSSSNSSAGTNLVSNIGKTAGCPTTRKIALVGIATDCSYAASFNSTSSARANIISQMNSASVLYENTFNFSLAIQNLAVSDATCPGSRQASTPWNQDCNSKVDITDRLNLFADWRGKQNDNNAYWTLLSNCHSGSAVGLAWSNQACVKTAQQGSTSSSGESKQSVSGANVVVKTKNEWLVIAHEVGHIFGAVHDCTEDTCGDGQTVDAQQCCPLSSDTCDAGEKYVMNPETVSGITHFSPCSVGNICSAIGSNKVKTDCLTSNKDVVTITGSQCGNGIVEKGEDCDCGGTEGCKDNKCCDPKTCKFKDDAVCDPSNEDCCTGSCQFSSSNTVCRASAGPCDPEEKCTGDTANCPADIKTPDGKSCGKSGEGLACASGHCTSRDQQCKSLMSKHNSTSACDNRGCKVSCASPSFDTCYEMQQNFLDGTACAGGGKCNNGQCKGTTAAGKARDWVNDHKPLVIGVAVGVGGLVLLSLISCVISSLRRRRAGKAAAALGQPAPSAYPRMPFLPQMWQPRAPYAQGAAATQPYGQWPAGAPPPYEPAPRYA